MNSSGHNSPTTRLIAHLGALLTIWLVGCSEAEHLAPFDPGDGAQFSGQGGRCQEGSSQRCSHTVLQNSGVHSCYQGVQHCVEGNWSACGEGEVVRVAPPSAADESNRPLAVGGTPITCTNACDPLCQHWLEPGNLTGTLNATLPDYPGGTGSGPTCAHELCSTGPALTESCDACVATVCATDPTCCGQSGGSWDELCVEAVFNLCLGEPQPLGLCDFGLFSASPNQVTVDTLVTDSDITIGGLGNVTLSGGRSVRRIITAGPAYLDAFSFPPLGVRAGDWVTVISKTANQTIGPIDAGGTVYLGQNPLVQGDVYSRGNISWEAEISGDAVAGGNVSVSGGCTPPYVGGSCTNGSSHPAPTFDLPTLPAQTFTCGGANNNVGGGNLTLDQDAPENGRFGDVYVGGRLTLNGAGTYNFNRLYAREIQLIGTGPYRIESCNEFNVLDSGRILNESGTLLTDPTQLYVSVKGNLHFDSNVDWVGIVQAGSSGTKTNGSIHGAIWASPVNNIVSQASIVGVPRDDCIASGLPGTAPEACPIVTASAPVPPAINEPCATGADCQINHSCVEPLTDPTCAHSKCVAGAGLSATCDTCVASICAVSPTCCSGTWDASCVALVASVCDAVCDGDAGTCTDAFCSQPVDGTSVCDFTVSAGGSVTVTAASSISPRPQVAGGIGAFGALTLNWADVTGDVWHGGSFSHPGATYGAEVTTGPSVFTAETFSCPASDGTPASGGIAPGNYGAVVVPPGQALTLSSGAYTFTSLILSAETGAGKARLALTAGAKVEARVCGGVTLGAGAEVTGLTDASALDLKLYAEGTLQLNAGAVGYGAFFSETNIALSSAEHHGMLGSANTVNVVGDSSIIGDGLRETCLLRGLDPSHPPSALTSVSESALCEPNAPGYSDATCAGYDLALSVPCGDQIPVCNHGAADYSGPVNVGYFEDAAGQMSNPSPPSATGSCTQNLTIPSGQCASMTCSGLPSGLLTMMVDPLHSLSECGAQDRRLDNWTVHDGRVCGGSATHEFEYVAVCDVPGTTPRWGLLTWNAEIPAPSSITFSGRVGVGATDADAALDAASQAFSDIIVADETLETCSPFGPMPCPVDLSEQLALGAAQGHHLDLRIILTGAAGENPNLSDWNITYSCVYDQ